MAKNARPLSEEFRMQNLQEQEMGALECQIFKDSVSSWGGRRGRNWNVRHCESISLFLLGQPVRPLRLFSGTAEAVGPR